MNISARNNRHLHKKGCLADVDGMPVLCDTEEIFAADQDEVHLQAQAASVSHRITFGVHASQPVRRLRLSSRLWPSRAEGLVTSASCVLPSRSMHRRTLPDLLEPIEGPNSIPGPGPSNGKGRRPGKTRIRWSAHLERTLKIDVLTCSRCGEVMTLIHVALGPEEIRMALRALGLPPRAPPIALARSSQLWGDFWFPEEPRTAPESSGNASAVHWTYETIIDDCDLLGRSREADTCAILLQNNNNPEK